MWYLVSHKGNAFHRLCKIPDAAPGHWTYPVKEKQRYCSLRQFTHTAPAFQINWMSEWDKATSFNQIMLMLVHTAERNEKCYHWILKPPPNTAHWKSCYFAEAKMSRECSNATYWFLIDDYSLIAEVLFFTWRFELRKVSCMFL